jgi:hypothetical protein
MTSSEMNHLQSLCREIETRLEQGETATPELGRLFAEISRLQSGEDLWFNLDPKAMGEVTRVGAGFKSDNDNGPGSASA